MTGTEFAARRTAIHLSQTDLALALDVGKRSIQRWEKAETVPVIAECAIEYLAIIFENEAPAD
jgi:DNA-binding transcriptional regulator YiaG